MAWKGITGLTLFFVSIVMLTAFCHIWAKYHGQRRLVYVFKPLTMAFICLAAILGRSAFPYYKGMIVTGLVFSTVGDVFLMLPMDRFAAGMIAFTAAHVCYIAAFSPEVQTLSWWPAILIIACGGAFFIPISPKLGKLKVPVLIYILVILVMVWMAWERWSQTGRTGSILAAVGASLFMISDAILAINRFREKFESAHALNLITYYAAQLMIAFSVGS